MAQKLAYILTGINPDRDLRGNRFPLLGIRKAEDYARNMREIEVNLLGWHIRLNFGLVVNKIDDILSDD